MEKKTSKLSVSAVILGVLGLSGAVFLGWITFGLSSFPAILGLIFSIISKKKDPDDKLAKGAFVVSLIAVIIGVIILGGCIACPAILSLSTEN